MYTLRAWVDGLRRATLRNLSKGEGCIYGLFESEINN